MEKSFAIDKKEPDEDTSWGRMDKQTAINKTGESEDRQS